MSPPAPAVVRTSPLLTPDFSRIWESTERVLDRIVPPTIALTFGANVNSLFDTPIASVPALTPKDSAEATGVVVAEMIISSALTVEVFTSAITVGRESTLVTDPPAAIEINPTAIDKVPT